VHLGKEAHGMLIDERTAGDCDKLKRRIRSEPDAQQRDRYRAALLAIEGQSTLTIMTTLARSRGFVQRWAYAYRQGGVEAITQKSCGGTKPKLDTSQQNEFITRFKAGPTEADGELCTLRGKDAVRILADEFGVQYSLTGAYQLLHRNGLSCLRPRPQHRKNDLKTMDTWLKDAPLLSKACEKNTLANKSKSGSKTKRDLASKAR
jgi:transposase